MNSLLHIHLSEHADFLHSGGIVGTIFDAFVDTVKMLPFLFVAFLIIEFLEHRAQDQIKNIFVKSGAAGPLVATLSGCVPQCGFSVLAANLYSSGVITLGTLIAVFLSTSDEAVILLAASPDGFHEVLKLIVTKIVIGLLFGYTIYFIEKKFRHGHHHSHDLCEQDHCGCEENEKVLRPALIHTVKVFMFLLIFTEITDLTVFLTGEEKLSAILLSESVFQPFFAAIIGLIPNCASSVMLTQLYIGGTLTFGSLISGLCVNAGAGLLILFRNKAKLKENFLTLGILYVCAIIPGLVLHILK